MTQIELHLHRASQHCHNRSLCIVSAGSTASSRTPSKRDVPTRIWIPARSAARESVSDGVSPLLRQPSTRSQPYLVSLATHRLLVAVAGELPALHNEARDLIDLPRSIHPFRICDHSPRRNLSHLAKKVVTYVFPSALHTLDVTCGGDLYSIAGTRRTGKLLIDLMR